MAIKIFIDQGHNASGANAGAEANGMREQDINYNVGLSLATLLKLDGRFEARLSRNWPCENLGTTNSESLSLRTQMANSWPADYFLSIHCNANVNTAINGTEMYVYAAGTTAYSLAETLLNSITANVGTRNNGVRLNPSLYVLRTTQMPAVLLELAYMTNTSDAALLRNNQFRFAQGIYIGLLRYFGL